MKAKKLGLAIGAVALVGAMSVGGTLAYLTADTNTVTNVFTGDNNDLGGTIKETFDRSSASSYLPGDVITKEPTFTNDSDSIDAYVAVKVSYLVDGKAVSASEFANYATVDYNTAAWTLVEEGTDSNLYMYNSILAAKATSAKVFSTVTVNTGIETVTEKTTKTVYTYVELDKNGKNNGVEYEVALVEGGKNYGLKETTVELSESEKTNGYLPSLEIVVTGYMVQADNQVKKADGSVDLDNVASQLEDLAYPTTDESAEASSETSSEAQEDSSKTPAGPDDGQGHHQPRP